MVYLEPKLVAVEIPEPETIDREEFFRDLEATTRLYDPMYEERMVKSLVERRARYEYIQKYLNKTHTMAPAYADAILGQLISELASLAEQRGHPRRPIYHPPIFMPGGI
jgi:hypothetical protein